MALNKSQAEAASHTTGPMLVLAGPGSGKTLTITERTKFLISRQGIDPSRILVVTFTKDAGAVLPADGREEVPCHLRDFPRRFFPGLKTCLWVPWGEYHPGGTEVSVYGGNHPAYAFGI